MRVRMRTWESGHTTRYHQWNHTRALSADKQHRTTNHIALPSRKVSSLISNEVFNIDAPANGTIRFNRLEQKHLIIRSHCTNRWPAKQHYIHVLVHYIDQKLH